MNSIAVQIADFLKEYTPFNRLTTDEILEIAVSIRVINLEKNKTVFSINDSLHDSFYVVASGLINLTVIAEAEETILTKCHEGTIFGLRPFFAKNNYMMNAKAREESVVYAIPIAVFRPFVASNSDVLNLLLENFAVDKRNANDKENFENNLISENSFFTGQQSGMQFFQNLSFNTHPLITTGNTVIKEIAQLMAEMKVNNALICEKNIPVGIVTDTDMSSKIATGRFPITDTVDAIMSYPVITVSENVSLAEAQLLMLKNNVTHLCVTTDGSDKTEIKGVISEHDLILAQANNPGVLIKEIKRSQKASELKQIRSRLGDIIQSSIQKNIPLTHISNIASEVNFAILKRAVEQSILELGSPPARFAWFSIGSQARKEQLLLTDQDNFLVFEDVAPEKYKEIKDYFIELATKAIAKLEKTGYTMCPDGHVASNIIWCKSVSDWLKQFDSWMKNPGEKNNNLSSIFFDYEIIFGDQKIEDALNTVVFENVVGNTLLFDFLGNDALRKNSPLSFFKKFLVEEEGPHKDKFDIKTRALLPLIDGARMFTMSYGIKGINNTYVRFKQLAITDSKHAEIYLDCADAYLTLTKFRTLEGIKNDDTGQYINIEELSKIDREKLKNALAPMKELEDLIKNKFQLTQFS
ncbi:DUF294 nucleotidyltransferase-like domain-containing protein [Flavobacterium algicola]|uniref:DUF294 nucleotidyltransferase-like domain-containing protein n=1 Tax=Flavobacterium algicola TaxID=556529 RepID=UPI001EFEE746|nr:DUF294 nucleotidyltransferase-like domain-containing protein [Flavobacterium algicola]MCG9792709.1 DUF294 nucleotidyltransferase-like domain-containing protein [Flavobacterium algicola]